MFQLFALLLKSIFCHSTTSNYFVVVCLFLIPFLDSVHFLVAVLFVLLVFLVQASELYFLQVYSLHLWLFEVSEEVKFIENNVPLGCIQNYESCGLVQDPHVV